MKFAEKYDKVAVGLLGGFILPLVTAFIIFLFADGNQSLIDWMRKIAEANIITHIITLSVFTNIAIFLIFNYFDMLKASRGVLGITIAWAVIVFCIKFLL